MFKMSRDYLLLCSIVAIVYYNSLNCEFSFDDLMVILKNKDLLPLTPIANIFKNDYWGTPMHKDHSHKSYRPVCILTYRLNYALHEYRPFGYHLVNLVLHLIATCLFKRICDLFEKSSSNSHVSLLSACMFALHPIHTEAVTSVVGRAELLSTIFALLAFITYVSLCNNNNQVILRLALFTTLLALSTLSKEQGLSILAVCIVFDVFIAEKFKLQHFKTDIWRLLTNKCFLFRIVTLLAIGIVFMAFRIQIMNSELPVFTSFDNPASASSDITTRFLTYGFLPAFNFWLLLYPSKLCADWTMNSIELVTSLTDARNLFSLSFYSFLILLTIKVFYSNNHLLKVALSLLVFPFIPASNLFFPVGFVLAERVLYAPSMGFAIFIAISITNTPKRLKPFLITYLMLTHGIKCWHRNFDWYNDKTLFTAAIKVNNKNAKLYNNLGHAFERENNHTEALRLFLKAHEMQTNDMGSLINIARAHKHLGEYEQAEFYYLKAKELAGSLNKSKNISHLRVSPQYLQLYISYANLLSLNVTRLKEADRLLKQTIEMRGDYVDAYINRGDVLLKLDNVNEALKHYEKALHLDPMNSNVLYNIGIVHIMLKNYKSAFDYLERCLQLDDRHALALYNSALLLERFYEESNKMKKSLRADAIRRLRFLSTMQPHDVNTYFNLGLIEMDEYRYLNAQEYFKLTLKVMPQHRASLYNMAIVLSVQNKTTEAVGYLEQLVRAHRDHLKGWLLLGEKYLIGMKNINKSEEAYNQALSIDAGNIEARYNLCMCQYHRGDYKKFQQCLQKFKEYLIQTNGENLVDLNLINEKIKMAKELSLSIY